MNTMAKIELSMEDVETLRSAVRHTVQLLQANVHIPAPTIPGSTDDPGEPVAAMPPAQRAIEAALMQMIRSVRILGNDIQRASDRRSLGCVGTST